MGGFILFEVSREEFVGVPAMTTREVNPAQVVIDVASQVGNLDGLIHRLGGVRNVLHAGKRKAIEETMIARRILKERVRRHPSLVGLPARGYAKLLVYWDCSQSQATKMVLETIEDLEGSI